MKRLTLHRIASSLYTSSHRFIALRFIALRFIASLHCFIASLLYCFIAFVAQLCLLIIGGHRWRKKHRLD
jgi:hypothetical protein